jgi:hypothetical protein
MNATFLPKGTVLQEYVGTFFKTAEADGVSDDNTIEVCDGFIDACHVGNLMRFINHDDNPNCIYEKCLVNGVERIFIVTCKGISATPSTRGGVAAGGGVDVDVFLSCDYGCNAESIIAVVGKG